MAKILKNSESVLASCAKRLCAGGLVAFPTETVYGLGASLWNDNAILNIFKTKERPKTDPLIVHVNKISDCENLISLNVFQRKCFDIISKNFWPGPLTIVLSASSLVPKSVMAGGDYVGIRMPSHPIAQKLLSLCKCPIAAPSANKFGHVSPTSAQHVLDDLKDSPELVIIEDDTGCEIGIESTVIKIEKEGKIKLLRPGAISLSQIQNVLSDQNVSRETFCEFQDAKDKKIKMFHVKHFDGDEAPGQNLTHYAPWIETYMISNHGADSVVTLQNDTHKLHIEHAAIIDFGKRYLHLKEKVKFYKDLSESADCKEAAQNLFDILRSAENTKDVKIILIAQIDSKSEMAVALVDRIYRAASGKFIKI